MKKLKWILLGLLISVFLVSAIYIKTDKILKMETEQIYFTSTGDLEPGEKEINIKKEKETIKTEYTYNSKIEEYSDGTGNAIIHAGMKYADSSGILMEDAKSLKTCEFCSNIKLNIDLDEKYPVKVIDYNYTSIKLNVEAYITELNKDIPIEVYSKETIIDDKTQELVEEKIVHYNDVINLKDIDEKVELTLPFGFGKEVKWGEHSSNISITETTNSGFVWSGDSCSNNGTSIDTSGDIDVGINDYDAGREARAFLEYNTTIIPGTQIILNSSLNILLDYGSVVSSTECANVYQCRYDTLAADDYQKSVGYREGPIFCNNPTDEVWYKLDLLTNLTTAETTQYCLRTNQTCSDVLYYWEFYRNTFLNITYTMPYSLNITNPTTVSPATGVSPTDKLTVRFNLTDDGTPLTTGVTQENVTIGGDICVPVTNIECSGTPTACGDYADEAACNINGTSCEWSGTEPDYTPMSCGIDCHGGDTTYPSEPSCTNYILADACGGASSCDGTDTVVDITLNGTTFYEGDHIGVSVDVMCYGATDDFTLWYYNGASWNREKLDATCSGQGKITKTDVIVINSATETQYIRAIATYGDQSADDECWTNTYGDNDDIAFDVGLRKSCSGTVNDCSNENYVNQSSCLGAGCDYGPINEFTNNDLGWELNCTVPAGCSGSSDLFVNATYGGITYNNTQTNAVDCAGVDTAAPTFSGFAKNVSDGSIFSDEGLQFNITITDDSKVHNWTFNWNETGSWNNVTNSTTLDFSPVKAIANVSVGTRAVGYTIGYQFCACDDQTPANCACDALRTFSITAIPTDTCTYSGSGDWVIDCADDCYVNTATSTVPDNLIFYGTGTFTIDTVTLTTKNVTLSQGCEIIQDHGGNIIYTKN